MYSSSVVDNIPQLLWLHNSYYGALSDLTLRQLANCLRLQWSSIRDARMTQLHGNAKYVLRCWWGALKESDVKRRYERIPRA